jgi:hypothetical protein
VLVWGPYSESGPKEPGPPGSFHCRVREADKIDVPNVGLRLVYRRRAERGGRCSGFGARAWAARLPA